MCFFSGQWGGLGKNQWSDGGKQGRFVRSSHQWPYESNPKKEYPHKKHHVLEAGLLPFVQKVCLTLFIVRGGLHVFRSRLSTRRLEFLETGAAAPLLKGHHTPW